MQNQVAVWSSVLRVSLPPGVGERQRRELGAFARYCVKRIEHEIIGGAWSVTLVSGGAVGFVSVVTVSCGGLSLEARGLGTDAVLTIWDAMCRIEEAIHGHRELPSTRCA